MLPEGPLKRRSVLMSGISKHALILAPAALTLLAAVADDRVPVAIRFGLVGGGDLKRKCFTVFERRSTIEPEAGNAQHRKLDGQHVALLPIGKVSWREVHRADRRIGKGFRIKSRRLLGVAVVPEADCVFCSVRHGASPSL